MKTRPRKSLAQRLAMVTLLAAVFSATSASAQYYGGLSLSQLVLTGGAPDPSELSAGSLDQGFSTPLVALRNARTVNGFKFSYPLAANLAIEGRYSALTRANYGAALLSESLAKNIDARNYEFDLVGSAPLFDRLSVFGRAGIQNLKSDGVTGNSSAIDFAASPLRQSATAARFGVGIRYDFSNSLGLRLEVERFRKLGGSALGDFNADNYSFGLMLKF